MFSLLCKIGRMLHFNNIMLSQGRLHLNFKNNSVKIASRHCLSNKPIFAKVAKRLYYVSNMTNIPITNQLYDVNFNTIYFE